MTTTSSFLSPPPTDGLQQEQIVSWASAELASLRADLYRALLARHVDTKSVEDILAKMQDVYARVALLSRLAGWISPWAPDVHELPRGAARDRPEAISPSVSPTLATSFQPPRFLSIHRLAEWDTLVAASDWLDSTVQQWPNKLAGLVDRSQVEAAAYGVQVDQAMMDRLNKELRDSIESGEGRDSWRDRLKGVIDTRAGFDESIARTTMHRAFNEGKREVLEEPIVADIFPYRQYLATIDNRVRESHREMNRKVYHKDSQMAKDAANLLDDWNCRCSEIPLTEAAAKKKGISSGGEGPATAASAAKKTTKPTPSVQGIPMSASAGVSAKKTAPPPAFRVAAEIDAARKKLLSDMQRSLSLYRHHDEIQAKIKRVLTSQTMSQEQKQAKIKVIQAHQKNLPQRFDLQEQDRKVFLDAFQWRPSGKVNMTFRTGVRVTEQRSIEKSRKFVEKIAARDLKFTVHPIRPGDDIDDAYAYVAQSEIIFGKGNSPSIGVHEISHFFEADPIVNAKVKRFLFSRVNRNKTVVHSAIISKMRDTQSSYEGWESFLPAFGGEKWKALYAATKSKSGNSEVVSMGIQRLYDSPVEFAKADPEYFNLMLEIVQGEPNQSGSGRTNPVSRRARR